MPRALLLRHKIILFSGFSLFLALPSFAQTALDSLLSVHKNQQGIELVQTLNELSWEYKNRNADTSLIYAKWSLLEAQKVKDAKSVAAAYNSLANSYEALGSLDSANTYHKKSLRINIDSNDSLGMADSYNNLGIIYDQMGQYDQSLENYFKALAIYELIETDFTKLPMVHSNIGIVYKTQKEYDKALSYYEKALKTYDENNYDFGIVITKGNMGSLLLKKGDYKNSVVYSTEAAALYKELGYNRYVPYMLVNTAIAQDSLKLYGEAAIHYKKAISSFRNDNNLYELTNALISYSNNQYTQYQDKNALAILEEGLALARQNHFKEFEVKAYHFLAKLYGDAGDYKKAFDYNQRYAKGKDSLFSEEKTKTIFELEAKYQTEKKEKEILEQRALIAEKELEVEQKNVMLYGSMGLALVLGLLGYLFYNQQKLRNRQLKKEGELKAALARIETQNKLQEQRLRISRDLHDNIGAQLTFIISSLDNLKYGFKNMGEKLSEKLTGISGFTSQTIYELRDTIWAMNKNQIDIEDLQARISNFIDKANSASEKIDFSFTIASEVDKGAVFSSVVGMNIYRIIQEGVNNALKYAEASMVSVHISEEIQKYSIIVKDNGNGFDLANVSEGNGLNNMKKRARDIDAEFEIKSHPGKGTTINLIIPKITK